MDTRVRGHDERCIFQSHFTFDTRHKIKEFQWLY